MTGELPTVVDLASDVLTHRFDDMFNPPGLTNFLGAVQVDHDVVAVRSINFPPFSQGDTVTGQLYLDGRLFRSYGVPVSVQWRPDRVVRTARIGDLEIETVTACPAEITGVVIDIRVTNRGASPRPVRLGLALASGATVSGAPWLRPEPPSEANRLAPVVGRPAVAGTPASGTAATVQGVDQPATRVTDTLVEVEQTIAAAATWRVGYVHVIDRDTTAALAAFDRLAADVPGVIEATTRMWNAEIAAVFSRDSGRFSGSLPILETDSDTLRRLYWWGALGVIWFKRDNPHSVLGRTYDTLMPRYWQTTTFIWDYSLSSMVHALLDPVPMRRHLEHWITTDIHTHFGTEWLTGGPVGYWYSVNDYAMTRLVRDYVRFTGDEGFLAHPVATAAGGARPVAEHLREWATAWQGLRGAHALADYGGIDNLLECVSSYTHEVASLNAANVWCLRVAAEVAEAGGDAAAGRKLREQAAALAKAVNELYVDGGGYWHARKPDGRLVPVRHCYDFATVGLTMSEDLPERQRAEMVDFFVRELQTPTWMRALSPYDPDASFSVRPDHQWNGAYPAWPADAARALYRLGRAEVATDWLAGLARSANQGPCGQAHFVEEAAEPASGGARKAPPQAPYLIDWACSSSGAWVSLVLEGVFGLDVDLTGRVTAAPQLARLDPDARLRGLVVRGREYDIHAGGVTPARSAPERLSE